MPRRRRLPSLVASTLATAVLAVTLGGCFTGKRPSFADDQFSAGKPTGDAAIDAVLAKLDLATNHPPTFTATYDIVVRFGNLDKTATVAVDGRNRSVTMGDVRYVQTPDVVETCRGTTCTTGLDAAAFSDSMLTVDFAIADAAKRLRLDAAAKIGPTATRTEQVAGQEATCVDVVQSTGTASYCVLDAGVLAKLTDADVYVTLTSFAATVDPSLFTPPTESTPVPG
ncbi:MAG: hypothetical protein QM733_24415 [Ilumatobacteraceae bacterium]